MSVSMIGSALSGIIPVICVTFTGIALLVAEALRQRDERMPVGGLGLIGLVGAGATIVLLWGQNRESLGVVVADNFGLFVQFVLVVIGVVTILCSPGAIDRDHLPAGEYYALLLFAIAGMMLMAVTRDLLIIFLTLEVFSIAIYVMTGLRREVVASTEGAFKYFLLGGFSSAFFLYGIAFTYGLAGSTHLDRVAAVIGSPSMSGNPLLLVALGLLLVGFAFKVSAVPFHMWTPDAYEGAPTVVTGFMSTAVKAAAFAAFVRVFLSAFEPLRGSWVPVLWGIALVTMIGGTVVGVVQTNVKRMLAYSSIAHAGYLLVGLIAASPAGKAAVLFYLASYAVTNLGAFGVVAMLATGDRPHDELNDFKGLWYRRPALATLMAIFLLSLGGFPPMAGFIAKWYIFNAAVQESYYGLAIVGVLTSVVSVYFYTRIIVMMYMTEEPADSPATPALSAVAAAGLGLAVIVVFYLGVLPARVLDLAAQSVATIF